MTPLNRIAHCDTLKAELDTVRPLDAHVLSQLRAFYRVGLTYASNALEGNTLTETETKVVLEDGITIGGKPVKDHLEALGHAKAYDSLYALLDKPAIEEADLLSLHRLILQGQDGLEAGQYRTKPVIITGSAHLPPHPSQVPHHMADWLAHQRPHGQSTQHPIEQAARAHLELVNIHPFMDGNGRTARLVMNLLLMRAGYPVTIIPPVLRRQYIDSLESTRTHGQPTEFIHFLSECVHESSKDLLKLVRHLTGS